MAQKGLIYCYTYQPAQKKYIGYTTNFKKRQNEHLTETRVNLEFHDLLREHYENFTIEILEDNVPISELSKKEKYYIQLYNSYENGYNLTKGGDGGFEACNRYWKEHPEEMKQHIQKIQPLAAKAANQWRLDHPDLEQQRLKKLHEKSTQWRKENPEKFQVNLNKAQAAAKEWRIKNPEQAKNNLEKAQKANRKAVLLLNTNEIFESISEASEQYNVAVTSISACCKGKRKSAGKDKEGKKLIWKYV